MTAYLDGELPLAVRNAIFDHLQECSACCDALGEASFNEILVGTVLKTPMKAPVAVRHNVMSAISRQSRQPVPSGLRSRLALRPAATFAAILALAATGWRSYTFLAPPTITVSDQPEATDLMARLPEKKPARPVAPKPAARPATPAPVATVTPRKPLVARQPVRTIRPTPRPLTVSPKPQPVPVPVVEPVRESLAAVGVVTQLTGTLQTRRGAGQDWQRYDPDLMADVRVSVRDRLRSTEDTVATLELNDGTVIKSNASTEFVVLRSPTRAEPRWVVQLVRGELWVSTQHDVKIVAPGVDVESDSGEFSVRSWDPVETSVLSVDGMAVCSNPSGRVTLDRNQATTASLGVSPRRPFYVEDPRGQLGWAYAPMEPFNPLDSGGTQA